MYNTRKRVAQKLEPLEMRIPRVSGGHFDLQKSVTLLNRLFFHLLDIGYTHIVY